MISMVFFGVTPFGISGGRGGGGKDPFYFFILFLCAQSTISNQFQNKIKSRRPEIGRGGNPHPMIHACFPKSLVPYKYLWINSNLAPFQNMIYVLAPMPGQVLK
jgi:hypothetical protein